ncbi:hypothetical protein CA951_02810 [Rhodococcus sp. NCIMB 12038]|nr:hypothetical protein CA951_02810 [Rhodococcus sp. NCIMB 12038]
MAVFPVLSDGVAARPVDDRALVRGHPPHLRLGIAAVRALVPQSGADAATVHAHLSGTAPAHPSAAEATPAAEPPDSYPIDDGRVLDPYFYERGTAARRSAHHELTDVTDLLDEIEDRADNPLAELDGILNDML